MKKIKKKVKKPKKKVNKTNNKDKFKKSMLDISKCPYCPPPGGMSI